MNKLSVRLFLTAALVCGIFFLTNCSSTPATNGNTAVVADKIGVPECDEYIQKWEACVNNKVPEAQRGTFKSSFETLRKTWKDAAANPQGKAGLATGCKQALDSAKQTYSAYGCAW